MKYFPLITLLSTVALLAACGNSVQTTSGAGYLAKHQASATKAATIANETEGFQKRLREAAGVEPTLTFPARIGLARAEGNYLSSIPAAEMESWMVLNEKLKANGVGELVPVSPLVMKMMQAGGKSDDTIVNQIRLGAARQHLDAVLIYETNGRTDETATPFVLTDLTIIGAYMFPSRALDSQALAAATLVDVISGYPYGQAGASAKDSQITTTHGSRAEGLTMTDRAEAAAVKNLTQEIEAMFLRLRAELKAKK